MLNNETFLFLRAPPVKRLSLIERKHVESVSDFKSNLTSKLMEGFVSSIV